MFFFFQFTCITICVIHLKDSYLTPATNLMVIRFCYFSVFFNEFVSILLFTQSIQYRFDNCNHAQIHFKATNSILFDKRHVINSWHFPYLLYRKIKKNIIEKLGKPFVFQRIRIFENWLRFCLLISFKHQHLFQTHVPSFLRTLILEHILLWLWHITSIHFNYNV